jgi:hypothetical protein
MIASDASASSLMFLCNPINVWLFNSYLFINYLLLFTFCIFYIIN